jgi:hypothetical protein
MRDRATETADGAQRILTGDPIGMRRASRRIAGFGTRMHPCDGRPGDQPRLRAAPPGGGPGRGHRESRAPCLRRAAALRLRVDVSNEFRIDLQEELAQLVHTLGTEAPDEPALEFGDDLASDRVDLVAERGCPDELGAAVSGVGHPFDVAVALEVRDELGHGLLGDLRPPGELADSRALGIEELQHVAVRRADLGMPPFGEPVVQQLVAAADGLAEQHAETHRGGERACFPGRAVR